MRSESALGIPNCRICAIARWLLRSRDGVLLAFMVGYPVARWGGGRRSSGQRRTAVLTWRSRSAATRAASSSASTAGTSQLGPRLNRGGSSGGPATAQDKRDCDRPAVPGRTRLVLVQSHLRLWWRREGAWLATRRLHSTRPPQQAWSWGRPVAVGICTVCRGNGRRTRLVTCRRAFDDPAPAGYCGWPEATGGSPAHAMTGPPRVRPHRPPACCANRCSGSGRYSRTSPDPPAQ